MIDYNQLIRPNYLDPQKVISTIVICNGNLELASEQLDRARKAQAPTDPPINKADIVRVLTQDPSAISSLQQQMRTYALIKTLETTGKLHDSMTAAIANMESADIAKSYVALLRNIGEFTDSHTQTTNINIRELLMRQLPPDVANAFNLLAGPTNTPQLSSGYMIAEDNDD